MGLLINIDRQSRTPLFQQIVEQIIGLIQTGALNRGDRLPPTRILARSLELNRSTICRAYEELWAAGYIESRPGSYSTVRRRIQPASRRPEPGSGLIPWAERSTPGAREVYDAAAREAEAVREIPEKDLVNFIPLSPDSRCFPLDDFRKCLNTVLAEQGEELLQYGSPLGHAPLRETVARRMNLHSVALSPQEVMITAGAQNAFELILKLLVRPGSGAVVEGPTYPRALDGLRLSGARLMEVPLTPEGMDLGALEEALARETPALIHTMSNFHNPSGITTGQAHREGLLRLCERFRAPLVEDGFEEEMKYFGRAVPPVKSMDRQGVVIYLGTFSKVLFPGLRIGWIAADRELIARLEPIQRSLILCGNLAEQAALDLFCRRGFYDLHLRKMHRVYRGRMRAALTALRTHLDPKLVRWSEPSGGYTIWLRGKVPGIGEKNMVAAMLDHGVRVLPGSVHYINRPRELCFRLSIAHLDEERIEEGICRVGLALKDLSQKNG